MPFYRNIFLLQYCEQICLNIEDANFFYSGLKEEEEEADSEYWTTMESREKEALAKCRKAILLDLVSFYCYLSYDL